MTTPEPIDPQPAEINVDNVHVDQPPDDPADDVPERDDELDPRARKAMAKLRHEAATNRIRAQEAEAKVAQLEGAAARLAALERAEVERLAGEQLIDAGDVWRIGADVQQGWYDEEFRQLQPDKVRESIEALVTAKPHLARRATPPPTQQPLESLRAGASPELTETKVTWNSGQKADDPRIIPRAFVDSPKGAIMALYTAGASPILSAAEIEALVVRPVLDQAVSALVSTVVTIGSHDLRIPVVLTDPQASLWLKDRKFQPPTAPSPRSSRRPES